MTPLRIAILGHIRHPIARPFMGGMEAFTWHLADGLARRGHDVHLLASGDSAAGLPPGVRLHPILETHYDATYPWHDFHGTPVLLSVLDRAHATACRILLREGFDVIHNNGLHRYVPRLSAARGLPMVTSLHIPPFEALKTAMDDSAWPGHVMTVTSRRQTEVWWPDGAPPTARVVHNGIDLAAWPFVPGGDGSAVWAGRITPTKGTHLAAQAARIAGVPLAIFGTIEHADYFKDEVQPHLSDDIVHRGHLNGAELAQAYARASALLFTPLWEEPFGLVAVEAMATGLPVAALDAGAVREVLGDGGVLANSNDAPGLAQALKAALSLDPAAVRRRVERQFGHARMLDQFEDCYAAAMSGARPVFSRPTFSDRDLPTA